MMSEDGHLPQGRTNTVLFIMPYKMVPTLECVDEYLECATQIKKQANPFLRC